MVCISDLCHIYVYSLNTVFVISFFFFFQAEDGIRDTSVTGVQTCALPIYAISSINEGKYRVLSDTMIAAFNKTPKSEKPIQIDRKSVV